MLDILKAYQGYNRCYTKGTPCTVKGLLLHETAAVNPTLKRYVEAPIHLGRNTARNFWNRVVYSGAKQVHGFIGYDVNGRMAIALTLPPEFSCWGVGGGKNGSYNYDPTKYKKLQRAHLQVEICRGPKGDSSYYWAAITLAERLYAHWCRAYNLDPLTMCDNGKTLQLTGHREAARAGFGSNHADPESYMATYGDSMTKWRQRVSDRLKGPAEEVRYTYEHAMPTFTWKPGKYFHGVKLMQECLTQVGFPIKADGYFTDATHTVVKAFRESRGITTPKDSKGNDKAVSCDAQTWAAINRALNGDPVEPVSTSYTGTVLTKTGNGIGLWASATNKAERVATLREGVTVRITGPIVSGYMAPATYSGAAGYCDTRYIANRK